MENLNSVASIVNQPFETPLVDSDLVTETCATTISSPPVAFPGVAASHSSLGEFLIRAGLITMEQLDEALRLQAEWGSRLGDIVLAMGWVKAFDFYQVLARHFQLGFVNLVEQPVDPALFESSECDAYARYLYLPWRRKDGVLWIATADPSAPELIARWAKRPDVRFIVTSKFDILWELQRVARQALSQQAVYSFGRVQSGTLGSCSDYT